MDGYYLLVERRHYEVVIIRVNHIKVQVDWYKNNLQLAKLNKWWRGDGQVIKEEGMQRGVGVCLEGERGVIKYSLWKASLFGSKH